MKKLILASASPRRKDLLTEYGFNFEIKVCNAEEILKDGLSPELQAVELALCKAQTVFCSLLDNENSVVLGADTIVVFNGKILGKPKNEQDAFDTLQALSGKAHEVITGYAIVSKGKVIKDFVRSSVTFNVLSKELIEEYIKSKLPFGKAGSYGIQDGYPLVLKCEGSRNNVIGLPVEIIKEKLQEELSK